MANTFIPKRSTVAGKVPLPADLQIGELAVNLADRKIYTKDANSAVVVLNDMTGAGFPAGTRMLFAQTAAPSGWTKDTTHNDKALRVVSGSVGSGGTVAFSTVFSTLRDSSTVTTTGTVGNTTLSTDQMPSHSHFWQPNYRLAKPNQLSLLNGDGISGGNAYAPWGYAAYSAIQGGNTSAVGGGGSHTHSLAMNSHFHSTNLNVQYVDVIIATKD